MRVTTSYAQFPVNETARAAREAHTRLMRDPFTTLYVYFKPMRIEAIAEGEPTDGYTLAWPERVPGNLTADQLVQWFAARTGRVPYLTEES
jgi:hypothetical protein